MSKITGKFEYDLETRELCLVSDDKDYPRISSIGFTKPKGMTDTIGGKDGNDDYMPDECALWFDLVDGKNKLAIISCEHSEALENKSCKNCEFWDKGYCKQLIKNVDVTAIIDDAFSEVESFSTKETFCCNNFEVKK